MRVLSVFAFLLLASMRLHLSDARAEAALCGGTLFPLSASLGPTPHVTIDVDGKPGLFLIDYGATQGTLWTGATGPNAKTRRATIALPGVASADFLVRYDADASKADAPTGIIGTDVLSQVTLQRDARTVWISAQDCDETALRNAGFRPIDQAGFFSKDRALTDATKPNVPVLFLRFGAMQQDARVFAQIDTGYADTPRTNSIDINQALYDRLGADDLLPDGETIVVTCAGVETRRAFRLREGMLAVTDEQGTVLRAITTHRLILKRSDRCGGIASMTEPAAQVGASFLHTLGTIIFEPGTHRVWVRADKQ